MKILSLIFMLVPAIAFGQYQSEFTETRDSVNLSYIGTLSLKENRLTINGDIINPEILKVDYDVAVADTGTGTSRYIVFRIKKLNDDTLTTSTRFLMHVWASTSEFGTPSKLSMVSIGSLTTGTKVYSPFALNWNPEGTVDHVLTDASQKIAFTMTSTGVAGFTMQWFMIELGGKFYTFSFNMYNAAS